jgi:probable aminopeptidase NPEPL1
VNLISFSANPASLIKGVRSLLVIAPREIFTKKKFPKIFDAATVGLLIELATDLEPGLLGTTASTLTGSKPRGLSVGMIPDKVSRYQDPSRAECIRKVTERACKEDPGPTGIVLLLDDESHALAAINAVSKALPMMSLKTGGKKRAQFRVLALTRQGKPIQTTKIIRETVMASRNAALLVDAPPTDMNPKALEREARSLLRGVKGVRTKVIVGEHLLKAGLGGLHAVGRCAIEAPRMLVATYSPKKSGGKTIALVGKGISYDTGGLHIKMRGSMETMKADMGGAAAALGAFRVLTTTGYPHKLHLLLCLAENAIGPAAYKPDDVLTMHSGKTVEINNTDAEGRVVLADGVSYAARVLKCDTILDAATLTGAQLIATGNLHAAVMSNDAELEQLLVAAGYASGDLAHALPFAPEFYKSEFASPIADMRNSVKNRSNAQSSCAAQFIHWHIEDTDARWGHIDLAGPAFRNDRATGFGVALLAETARRL